MNILMIAENDPAGTAILFAKAINRLTRHTCRLITQQIRYNHMWEKDLFVPWLNEKDWDEVEHLLKRSDLFHFHMTVDENVALGPFTPKDYLKGKIVVHHHHGHHDFRGNPEKYRAKYKELRRKALLVSTPDLLHLLPEANWQPNLVPISEPLYLPEPEKPETPVTIAHSPTRKDLKNTDELLLVMDELSGHEPKIELELLDNVEHTECLARKRRCHAVFDHMQGYYGVSSLEGLSQGMPVIAGLNEWCRDHMAEFSGTQKLPWVAARNKPELKSAIAALAKDLEQRKEIGLRSREFMEEHWNEEKVAQRLISFYEAL